MDNLLLRLQGLIDRPRSPPLRILLIVAAILAIAALRWTIDRGENGFSFSPFFPVVLSAALLTGWRYGLFAALLSFAVVWAMFFNQNLFGETHAVRVMLITLFALTIGIILFVTEGLRRVLEEARERARIAETWNDELHHRASNLMQILVNWIERGLVDPEPRPYFSELSDRLVAWSRSNAMLRATLGPSYHLDELADLALAPFPTSQFRIAGPEVIIDSTRSRAVAVALHELATNSVKYGALAQGDGVVELTWTTDVRNVTLCWDEKGAPQSPTGARPPQGSGFGLALLAALRDIDRLETDYRSGAMHCSFAVERMR